MKPKYLIALVIYVLWTLCITSRNWVVIEDLKDRVEHLETTILDYQHKLRNTRDRVEVLEAERYTIEVKAVEEEMKDSDPFK